MDTSLIREELFKVLNTFVNELELTMDFISKDTIDTINKYIQKIYKNKTCLNKFTLQINNYLKQYSTYFAVCLFSNKKIKSNYYDFLYDIKIFGDNFDLLDFSIFKNESKNTKKDITGYLYSIYMACVFLSHNYTQDQMSEELLNFVDKIKIEANNKEQKQLDDNIEIDQLQQLQNSHSTILQRRNAITYEGCGQSQDQEHISEGMQNMMNSILGDSENDGLNTIMNDILGNTDIMSLAKNMAQEMQTNQINPMSMMSSLMSGNIGDNNQLQNIMDKIKTTVDIKIDSGELNVNNIQNQAQDIMKNLGSTLQGNSMQDMFKQFTNGSEPKDKEEMEAFVQKMMNEQTKKQK